jgi:hypothetical protein
MEFFKNQKLIDPAESSRRQHAIPEKVHQFAELAQMEFKGSRGRGRGNVPTLPDIYYTLAKEGFTILSEGRIKEPEFCEIGRPDGCVFAQIVFEKSFDDELRNLKAAAESGIFPIKPYREISLISLVVNLIQYAIDARENPLKYKRKRSKH